MFTGIVQGQATVQKIIDQGDLKTFTVSFPKDSLENLKKGASIALNGVCLTATAFDTAESTVNFDVMNQSLNLTNLSDLETGQTVNFERAAKFGDEIGGHLMSGHIYQTVQLTHITSDNNQYVLQFELPEELQPYIFNKGFVGINGCSLTIAETGEKQFSIHLIPETLDVTTFKTLKTGDYVNVEIDPQTQAVVDTVNNYLSKNS